MIDAASRVTWRDLFPVMTMIVTIVTLFVGGGKVLRDVETHTSRLTVLERRADRRDDEMSDLKARIAGMDAKLDLLINRTSPAR